MSRGKINHDEAADMNDASDEASHPLTGRNSVEITVAPTHTGGSLHEANGQTVDDIESASAPGQTGREPEGKPPIGFHPRIGDDPLERLSMAGDWPKHSNLEIPPYLQPPLSSIPDVNVYQHKKTLAQGMMDLALLSANANQLRYVLQTDGKHPYYYPSLAMIGASLFLQVAVGIGLIWNSRYNVKDDAQMCKAERANNWTVIGVFLVTILNVFISSFGVADQMTLSSTTTTTSTT